MAEFSVMGFVSILKKEKTMSQETYDFGVGDSDENGIVSYDHVIRVEVFHQYEQETLLDIAIETLGAVFFCCTVVWFAIQSLAA